MTNGPTKPGAEHSHELILGHCQPPNKVVALRGVRQAAVSTFVRTPDEQNFGGPAEASSEGWGPHGTDAPK